MLEEFEDKLSQLTPHELSILKWRIQRRPEQKAPAPLPLIWFLLGGRGSGKTKTGANHLFELACNLPWNSKNRQIRIALVGNTYDDVKKTMVEGDSGLLSVIPEEIIKKWNRTIGELTVEIPSPDRKKTREIIFSSYTATTPDKLRGPQFHLAWIDEPAKFEDSDENPMDRDTTWSNLILGLRLGTHPHLVVTGTPTPCKLVLYLLDHEDTVTTVMTTWANRDNLPPGYKRELERLDPNSRTYRQEVMAEILLDNPNALFSDENINRDRRPAPKDAEHFYKVLGYDPSASSSDDADEAGIILVGYTPEVKSRAKLNGTGGGRPIIEQHTEAYVLKDLSGHYTPAEQAALVVDTILEEKVTDLILEQNAGADMVVTLLSQSLKDKTADFVIRQRKKRKITDFGPVKRFDVTVTTLLGESHKFLISAVQATKNKKTRAETASYQYDYGRVHHPPEETPLPVCKKEVCKTSLEYELTTWNPANTSGRYMSPNRMDALVYAIYHIFGRHALHSNANSKLHMPATNRAASAREDQQIQATNRKIRNAITTIYSVDLGGGRLTGRVLPDENEWYNRNLT